MQVPFTLTDNDLSDNWECTGNLWDPRHASCAVPQELSDQEIDEILALQVGVHDADASICCVPKCVPLHAHCCIEKTQASTLKGCELKWRVPCDLTLAGMSGSVMKSFALTKQA